MILWQAYSTQDDSTGIRHVYVCTYIPVILSCLQRLYIIFSWFRRASSVSAVNFANTGASSLLMINPYKFSSSLFWCVQDSNQDVFCNVANATASWSLHQRVAILESVYRERQSESLHQRVVILESVYKETSFSMYYIVETWFSALNTSSMVSLSLGRILPCSRVITKHNIIAPFVESDSIFEICRHIKVKHTQSWERAVATHKVCWQLGFWHTLSAARSRFSASSNPGES